MYPSRQGCKPPDRGRFRRTDFRPEIARCISFAGVSKGVSEKFRVLLLFGAAPPIFTFARSMWRCESRATSRLRVWQ
jgi:hypothetical protein